MRPQGLWHGRRVGVYGDGDDGEDERHDPRDERVDAKLLPLRAGRQPELRARLAERAAHVDGDRHHPEERRQEEVVHRHREDDAPEGGRGGRVGVGVAPCIYVAFAASKHIRHETRVATEECQAEREQVLAAEVL